MFFGIKSKKKNISNLKKEIKEIKKFKSEYERISKKIEENNKFEFNYWFDNSNNLGNYLRKKHQENLSYIREKAQVASPKEFRGNEGYKFSGNEIKNVKDKIKETIKDFDTHLKQKNKLLEEKKESLRKRRKALLILLLGSIYIIILIILYSIII